MPYRQGSDNKQDKKESIPRGKFEFPDPYHIGFYCLSLKWIEYVERGSVEMGHNSTIHDKFEVLIFTKSITNLMYFSISEKLASSSKLLRSSISALPSKG